jgi:uncharacterized membrane protein
MSLMRRRAINHLSVYELVGLSKGLKPLVLMIILAALVLMMFSAALAQEGGQFCVRAFEDRNSNGTRDASEPFLTQGIAAELSNAQGVVIASAGLEDSPQSAAGVICFANLATGAYTLAVISADYTATTANTLAANITPGGVPTVLEFGGTLAAAQTATTPTATSLLDALQLNNADGRSLVERVVIALLGALAIIAVMVIMGVFIWSAILRPRALKRIKRATSTGQYRAVTREDMLSMYAPPSEDEPSVRR